MKHSAFWRGALTTLLLALLTFALMRVATLDDIQISPLSVQLGNQAARQQALPWQEDFSGHYQVALTLSHVRTPSLKLRIYPDDELLVVRVNGQSLSLENISLEDRRSYANGFVLNIPGLIPGQDNKLEFELENNNGPAGFKLKTSLNAGPLKLCAAFVLLLGLILTLRRHIRISRLQMALACLSIAVSLLYLSATDSRTRTFDVYEGGGHLDYVNYILTEHALPEAGNGWEYHQPPLYYLLAAAAKSMTGPAASNEVWGQLFALELWAVFLIAGLACLRQGMPASRPALLLASTAFALWPAGIIHSVRLGNDAALYASFALSFLYAVRWWSRRRETDLWLASVWMAAAVISKSSGLALSALLCTLVVLDAWRAHQRAKGSAVGPRLRRNTLIVGACLLAGFAINLGDNIYDYLRGTSSDWLLANVTNVINSGLRVSNSPDKYLIFDLASFLQHPFISSWDDQFGRQYFWNFLLRSSLSSEFMFEGKTFAIWGASNGIFLLIALLSMPVYFLQRQVLSKDKELFKAAWRHLPWWLAGSGLLLLLLAYRIKLPYACNTDFRYIYPALICLLYFIALPWRRGHRLPIARTLALAPLVIAATTLVWAVALAW